MLTGSFDRRSLPFRKMSLFPKKKTLLLSFLLLSTAVMMLSMRSQAQVSGIHCAFIMTAEFT
jgi:hypothetical protein